MNGKRSQINCISETVYPFGYCTRLKFTMCYRTLTRIEYHTLSTINTHMNARREIRVSIHHKSNFCVWHFSLLWSSFRNYDYVQVEYTFFECFYWRASVISTLVVRTGLHWTEWIGIMWIKRLYALRTHTRTDTHTDTSTNDVTFCLFSLFYPFHSCFSLLCRLFTTSAHTTHTHTRLDYMAKHMHRLICMRDFHLVNKLNQCKWMVIHSHRPPSVHHGLRKQLN